MSCEGDGAMGRPWGSVAQPLRVAVFSNAVAIPRALERATGLVGMAVAHHPLSKLHDQNHAYRAEILWVILSDDIGYDGLLALDRHVADEAIPLVLQVSQYAIDTAWAIFGDRDDIVITIDPDEGACAVALAQAQRTNEPYFASEADNISTRQFDKLQEEVQRISKLLSHLAIGDGGTALFPSDHSREPASPFLDDYVRSPSRSFSTQSPHATVSPREVRRIIRERRMRDELFPAEMFADPAWDMLLDLYAAKLDRARVSVSSLCIAAAVPATTALRWIKTLTETGIFLREADQLDGRRIFVTLSDQATDAMHRYFAKRAEL